MNILTSKQTEFLLPLLKFIDMCALPTKPNCGDTLCQGWVHCLVARNGKNARNAFITLDCILMALDSIHTRKLRISSLMVWGVREEKITVLWIQSYILNLLQYLFTGCFLFPFPLCVSSNDREGEVQQVICPLLAHYLYIDQYPGGPTYQGLLCTS